MEAGIAQLWVVTVGYQALPRPVDQKAAVAVAILIEERQGHLSDREARQVHTKAYDAVWIGKGAIEVEIKGA